MTKRGMDLGLTLNRDLGVMLTGNRVTGHLSYDVGLFNPPGRSLSLADLGRKRTRLQANVVVVGGDEAAYSGVRGFRADALLVQLMFLAAN